MPGVSLIVTTYNRPDALERVLESLERLAPAPLEALIADDGSGPETTRLIRAWQVRLPFPLRHVWQPDEGFRAAMARNRAAARAAGEYLVFLDGDCLVFPDFLRRHLDLAEPGRYTAGNRLLLSPRLTERVLAGREQPLAWGGGRWLRARLVGEVNRLLPLLRLPDGGWRRRAGRRWQGARTCNLAVWRGDFLAVNGFDEAYRGWGHEDADLAARLIDAGILRKDGRNAVPVLHLWHPTQDRGRERDNLLRLAETLSGRLSARAEKGVDQY